MKIATLTSKGQVTIPVEVRNALGLHTGDRLEFSEAGDGKFEVRPASRSVEAIRGSLAHLAPASPISVEELNAAVIKALSDTSQ